MFNTDSFHLKSYCSIHGFQIKNFSWSCLLYFPEFEKYSVPEDLITLGVCAVPGLACFPPAPHLWEHDLKDLNPLPVLSPVKMPKHSGMELSRVVFVLIKTDAGMGKLMLNWLLLN